MCIGNSSRVKKKRPHAVCSQMYQAALPANIQPFVLLLVSQGQSSASNFLHQSVICFNPYLRCCHAPLLQPHALYFTLKSWYVAGLPAAGTDCRFTGVEQHVIDAMMCNHRRHCDEASCYVLCSMCYVCYVLI